MENVTKILASLSHNMHMLCGKMTTMMLIGGVPEAEVSPTQHNTRSIQPDYCPQVTSTVDRLCRCSEPLHSHCQTYRMLNIHQVRPELALLMVHSDPSLDYRQCRLKVVIHRHSFRHSLRTVHRPEVRQDHWCNSHCHRNHLRSHRVVGHKVLSPRPSHTYRIHPSCRSRPVLLHFRRALSEAVVRMHQVHTHRYLRHTSPGNQRRHCWDHSRRLEHHYKPVHRDTVNLRSLHTADQWVRNDRSKRPYMARQAHMNSNTVRLDYYRR